MFPLYYNYFKNLQKTLEELTQVVNKKWTENQVQCYQIFLTDVNDYIRANIWGRKIADFNMFFQAMSDYCTYTNPVGF